MLNSADKILFRASSMGDIMTGVAKGWDIEHSLACKRKLVKIFREHRYSRKYSKDNKYTIKGNAAEQDGITLYSRVKSRHYNKNDKRLNNLFFTGECDLFDGDDVEHADETIDIKCSWSLDTFPSIIDVADKDYEYQGGVYMDLTGAKRHTVAYCLVNTPANLIMDEKRILAYKMGVTDFDKETDEYIQACQEIEKNAIYDMELFLKHYPYFDFHMDIKQWSFDIPKEERVLEIVADRDGLMIDKMKGRVSEARSWMNQNLFKNALVAA